MWWWIHGKLWARSEILNSSPPLCKWDLGFTSISTEKHKYSCFCCSATLFSLAYRRGAVNSHSVAVELWCTVLWKQEAALLYRCYDKELRGKDRGDERNLFGKYGSCVWVPTSSASEAVRITLAATLWFKKSVSIFLKNNSLPDTPFSALSFWFHIPIFIYHLPPFFSMYSWSITYGITCCECVLVLRSIQMQPQKLSRRKCD